MWYYEGHCKSDWGRKRCPLTCQLWKVGTGSSRSRHVTLSRHKTPSHDSTRTDNNLQIIPLHLHTHTHTHTHAHICPPEVHPRHRNIALKTVFLQTGLVEFEMIWDSEGDDSKEIEEDKAYMLKRKTVKSAKRR